MSLKESTDCKIFELHAEVCKTLAHPKRLEILYALKEKELCVGDLVARLRVPKANVSQHLSQLRLKGVVTTRRDGLNVYYSISNPKIIQACMLMREVLKEHIEKNRRFLANGGQQ